jgi:hypothetical protein
MQATPGRLAHGYPFHEEKFKFAVKRPKSGAPRNDKTSFIFLTPLRQVASTSLSSSRCSLRGTTRPFSWMK